MRKIFSLKYILAFSLYIITYIAFLLPGYWTYALIIYAYGIIPFIELFYKPNINNITKEEEIKLKQNKVYDYLLYAMVPLHFFQ